MAGHPVLPPSWPSIEDSHFTQDCAGGSVLACKACVAQLIEPGVAKQKLKLTVGLMIVLRTSHAENSTLSKLLQQQYGQFKMTSLEPTCAWAAGQAGEMGCTETLTGQEQGQLLQQLPGFVWAVAPYLGNYALQCTAVFEVSPDTLNPAESVPQVSTVHHCGCAQD